MFAVIRTGGKQYRVREGERIAVERLDADEGADVTFDEVLAVGEGADLQVGSPTVEGASVTARVEAQGRGRKVTFFHYKNKTRNKRMRGHRQDETRLVITGIRAG
jgi:large subunit ribosomal protein L21